MEKVYEIIESILAKGMYAFVKRISEYKTVYVVTLDDSSFMGMGAYIIEKSTFSVSFWGGPSLSEGLRMRKEKYGKCKELTVPAEYGPLGKWCDEEARQRIKMTDIGRRWLREYYKGPRF